MPDSPQHGAFDHDEDEFAAPPEPEQIWPPPDPAAKVPNPQIRKSEVSFSGDPELAWEDETDKIEEAINEIRHLDDTGEADQVETESELDDEIDDEFEVLAVPSPQANVGHIVAGTAPVIFKPTKGPPLKSREGDTAQRGPRSFRRVNEAAEGEIAQLWNNVFFSGERAAPRSVIVTASRRGDGATQIASSLAMIGAEANPDLRIVLVDLNLRSPDVASVLGLRNEPGMTDILDGRATLEQALQTIQLSGGCSLNVIVAGRAAAHPLSLIKSRQMQALVASIREQFDHSIIDVASSDAYPDAQVIGTIVDGALLVVSGGSTPRETVADAKKRLDLARVRSLGLVLNQRNDPIPELLYKMA
ncbi:MAG: CpsD/CapB family tyrosine-protein kinase [Planctomycetes bacterium]|nr:CpsD/CapB family tyrosine-protein kinase [Planctomycetota bacterium]